MKRYFHFGNCQRFLFKTWTIVNEGDLVGAMCAIYILGILYEGLKSLRNFLIYCSYSDQEKSSKNESATPMEETESFQQRSYSSNDDEPLQPSKSSNKVKRTLIILLMHFVQALLHLLQIGYGYILMFAAMTFNGWLFLSVCFGAGTGYLIFAKTKWLKQR